MHTPNNRSELIDVCKGIGILCVYYGHTATWGTLSSRTIFSFHMPLFFFLSGLCFNMGKIGNVKELFIKIYRGLLLPYCFFVIVGSLLRCDIVFPSWRANPVAECIKLIHGEGSNAIWFLACLAVVQALIWTACKAENRFFHRRRARCVFGLLFCGALLIGSFVISKYLPQNIVSRLPFMLASVPVGMLFFYIGNTSKGIIGLFERVTFRSATSLTVLFCVFALLFFVNLKLPAILDVRSAIFSPRVLPSCILGLVFVLVAGKTIVASRYLQKVFASIGERSLFLFALELPISHVVDKITRGGVPYPCWLTDHTFAIEPIRILTILSLAWLCSYPTMWLLSNFRRLLHV